MANFQSVRNMTFVLCHGYFVSRLRFQYWKPDADILYLTQTIQLLEGRSYTVSLQWIYSLDSLTWLDCGQISVAEIMQ